MKTFGIPQKLLKEKDIVVIPRKEYQELLFMKRSLTFKPTRAERAALQKARSNFAKGKTLSLYEFRSTLERRD